MYVAILGRQPAIGMAELERLYGESAVRWFSDMSTTIEHEQFNFDRLGGSQKAGRVVQKTRGDWRTVSIQIVGMYEKTWNNHDGKITLGISAYGFSASPRDVQRTGIMLKQKLKHHGVSLRLIPNAEPALGTATSHHNKLGLSHNHVELLVIRNSSGGVLVAESVGSQNITALAARDQARPHTDAFVGMLPPKLARMMVNMATGALSDSLETASPAQLILDPFCGTGVVLQEAALLGYNVYGTDLSEKMVDYSTKNLDWLSEKYRIPSSVTIEHGDAMTHSWNPTPAAVVAETYLGQPFSAPPSPAKLVEVRGNCNHIITQFLKNIVSQLPSGTPLCLAVPAWRDSAGLFTHLPFISQLDSLGYQRVSLKHVRHEQLLYYRETQVVARELLLLKRS